MVDVLDVAKQRAFILRAQTQPSLVADTLQVVLQREEGTDDFVCVVFLWIS